MAAVAHGDDRGDEEQHAADVANAAEVAEVAEVAHGEEHHRG
jgi:hypothetical protein